MRWKRTDIGTGIFHAGRGGRPTLRSDDQGEQEYALCLDDKTGKDIWTTLIGDVGINTRTSLPRHALDSDH